MDWIILEMVFRSEIVSHLMVIIHFWCFSKERAPTTRIWPIACWSRETHSHNTLWFSTRINLLFFFSLFFFYFEHKTNEIYGTNEERFNAYAELTSQLPEYGKQRSKTKQISWKKTHKSTQQQQKKKKKWRIKKQHEINFAFEFQLFSFTSCAVTLVYLACINFVVRFVRPLCGAVLSFLCFSPSLFCVRFVVDFLLFLLLLLSFGSVVICVFYFSHAYS